MNYSQEVECVFCGEPLDSWDLEPSEPCPTSGDGYHTPKFRGKSN